MQTSIPNAASPTTAQAAAAPTDLAAGAGLAFPVLVMLSIAHLLNDMMQSLVPAIYPIIKDAHGLDFGQIGMITLTFQLTASLFQPAVGHITDRHPQPYSMVAGMAFSLIGLVVLAFAASYPMLLLGAGLVGTGSAIFHPEATRIARLASGGRQGFAQSIFQLGGQSGAALGPVLAAFVVLPRGQWSVALFAVVALAAMMLLASVGRWYSQRIVSRARKDTPVAASPLASRRGVAIAVILLVVLMFSKSAYQAAMTSFYTFFLIERFGVSIGTSQMLLFVYLAAGALGVLIGGPLGDRIGRRRIIWVSILGALPFSLMLPFTDLFWTAVLSVVIAVIMASAFAAILVFAMELLPGNVGLVGGIFYGLVFGLGAVSAAALGELADRTNIETVFQLCALLPAIGLLTWFLPDIRSAPIPAGT